MRAIFISYRRNDAEGHAGRLFKDLDERFGSDAVFMAVADIEPGRDFRRVIEQHVTSCGVLLAVVGKSWIDSKDESGRSRLDDPGDFVRLETATALKRDIPVVPVLVQGARIPKAEELPADLQDLAFRNAFELTHTRWDSDVEVLTKALRAYAGAEKPAVSPPPAEHPMPTSHASAGPPPTRRPRSPPVTGTPPVPSPPRLPLTIASSLPRIRAAAAPSRRGA